MIVRPAAITPPFFSKGPLPMFKTTLFLALATCLLLPLTAPGQEPVPAPDSPSTPVPDVPSSLPTDPESTPESSPSPDTAPNSDEQRIRDQHAAAELRYRNLAAQREKLEADFKAALNELLKQHSSDAAAQTDTPAPVTPPAAPSTPATEIAPKPQTSAVTPAEDDAKKKSSQQSPVAQRPSQIVSCSRPVIRVCRPTQNKCRIFRRSRCR